MLVGEVRSLMLRNDRAEVARMITWVDEVVAPFHLSASTLHALQLCLEEAVTNVVSYAFEPDTVHDIRVALWRDGAGLYAEVIDDGRPFDPLTHELPPPPKDLQSAPIGGLGIKLMRNFAKKIVYRRSGSTNHLKLSFPVT